MQAKAYYRGMGKKGDLQRERIIQSATYCLSEYGDRGATFQTIAEHCGISQASVVKYLKTRDEIFPTVLNYWLERARRSTEDLLADAGDPEARLREYIKVSIQLFFEKPEINKIYLLLHYFAAFDERYRVINSQIKSAAQARIAEILKAGMDDGSFRDLDVLASAKTLHNSLVGFLISAVTEISKPTDLRLPMLLEQFCLDQVLKAKKPKTKGSK